MDVELTIVVDTDGNILTTVSGDPQAIRDAYTSLPRKSPVTVILKNLLRRSAKETRGAN